MDIPIHFHRTLWVQERIEILKGVPDGGARPRVDVCWCDFSHQHHPSDHRHLQVYHRS